MERKKSMTPYKREKKKTEARESAGVLENRRKRWRKREKKYT